MIKANFLGWLTLFITVIGVGAAINAYHQQDEIKYDAVAKSSGRETFYVSKKYSENDNLKNIIGNKGRLEYVLNRKSGIGNCDYRITIKNDRNSYTKEKKIKLYIKDKDYGIYYYKKQNLTAKYEIEIFGSPSQITEILFVWKIR